MKKFFLIILAVAIIGALIFSSCKSSSPTTTTPTQTQTSTATTTTTPHKVLKIGNVQALNMSIGVEQKKWFDLFAKLVNEQGGWKIGYDTYDIQIITYDSQYDPVKGKMYLEKLVLQDGVKFIFGSPTFNAATDTEVTEPNKVILLGQDFTGVATGPKTQYFWEPMGMFFARGSMYHFYKDMDAKGMKSYVSLKIDDMMGHVADGWCNTTWALAAPDVKYLDTVFFESSTSDYGPVATKIMSLNPDVVDTIYSGVGAAAYNALYDAGYKGSLLCVFASELDNTISHCGNAWVDGWETGLTDPRNFPDQDPAMLALMDAYTKEYGTFHDDGCQYVCDWFVMKDAIDSTQSVDPDIIKAYLDNQPHPVRTLTGYCQLFARPDLGNLRTICGEPAEYTGIVKDGKLVPLAQVTVKDHYLASILSYGLVDVYKAYWEQYGFPEFPPQESLLKFSDLGITGHD